MEFIENGKVIQKEQDEKSKNCKHEIKSQLIDDTRYRFCKHCGKWHRSGQMTKFIVQLNKGKF